jgi:hypothetical protein
MSRPVVLDTNVLVAAGFNLLGYRDRLNLPVLTPERILEAPVAPHFSQDLTAIRLCFI